MPTAHLVWSVMLAGIVECGVPAMSLADNGFVYTGQMARFRVSDSRRTCGPWAPRRSTRAPFHPQTCGKIERLWQTLKKWLRAPPPHRAPSLSSTQSRPDQFRSLLQPSTAAPGCPGLDARRSFHSHSHSTGTPHRPTAAGTGLRDPSHRERNLRPAVRPAVSRVNVGRRWAGHVCDSIRDGEHIAIFSGTTLVREFTADPNRSYQLGDKTTRTYRTREPKPAP